MHAASPGIITDNGKEKRKEKERKEEEEKKSAQTQ